MTELRTEEITPAYREPWFWMVVSPLILVVAVCSVLITYAYTGKDDRVVDDYYQQGRLINKQFESEKKAAELGIRGVLNFDFTAAEVVAKVESLEPLKEFNLLFSHPSYARNDHSITLEQYAPNHYRAELDQKYMGRWYLILTSESESGDIWRVATEADFNGLESVAFSALTDSEDQ